MYNILIKNFQKKIPATVKRQGIKQKLGQGKEPFPLQRYALLFFFLRKILPNPLDFLNKIF